MFNEFEPIVIDSRLEREKILSYAPPPTTDNLTRNDKYTAVTLIALFETNHSISSRDLKKHIGDESIYINKVDLINGLSLIYDRLNGEYSTELGAITDTERKIILEKLNEEIEFCTPGFHNRIQEIILSWSKPKNFSQLVHLVRESLVAQVASTIETENILFEVHTYNRVFTVANISGFAVRARNDSDVFHGELDDAEIYEKLNEKFSKQLTVYNLVLLISDSLKSVVTEYYYGVSEKGYANGEVDKIISLINQVLAVDGMADLTLHDCFVIEYDEVSSDVPKITAVDWNKLNQAIFARLQHAGYFTCVDLEPISGVDFLAFIQLNFKDSQEKIVEYVKKHQDLIDSTTVFRMVFKQLSSGRRDELFSAIATNVEQLIKSMADLEIILSFLKSDQKKYIFEAILPQLPSLIKSGDDLGFIFSELFPFYHETLLSPAKLNLMQYICTLDDLRGLLEELSPSNITKVCNLYEDQISQIVVNATHLGRDLFWYLNAEQIFNFMCSAKHLINEKVKTTIDCYYLCSPLTTEQRTAVFAAVSPERFQIKCNDDVGYLFYLLTPTEIITLYKKIESKINFNPREISELLRFLSTEQTATLCKVANIKIRERLNSPDNISDLLWKMDAKKIKVIYEHTKVKINFFITAPKNAAAILIYLTSQELQTLCSLIKHELEKIIISSENLLEFFKHFNKESRMVILEALKYSCHFKQLLATTVTNTGALQELLQEEISPGDLLAKPKEVLKAEGYCSFIHSLAALALLKEKVAEAPENPDEEFIEGCQQLKLKAEEYFAKRDIYSIDNGPVKIFAARYRNTHTDSTAVAISSNNCSAAKRRKTI